MKRIIIISAILFLTIHGYSQEKTLKEQALDEFKAEHYNEAIALLEKAVSKSPNDAEIYYYLGYFNHYLAYDSRPLKGYNFEHSKLIFNYLNKALALNPNYGDAKYFYSAECGAIAIQEMQNNNLEKVKSFYKLAYNKGGFPTWLIEFGKNYLNSCDKDAILFTGGDADFNICLYLQLIENFRTDITVIPLGLIDRPRYVQFLKNGLEDVLQNIKLNLTEQQIMDIHPYKWKNTIITIPVSSKDKIAFKLPENYQFNWLVTPDFTSERMQLSRIEGEEATKRTFLSPQRALLAQIVEDNFEHRSIYFSNFANPSFYSGLEVFFQDCGLVSKLTPIKTADTEYAFNIEKFEQLFEKEHFEKFPDIKINDIPRIGMIYGYYPAIRNLSDYYRNQGNTRKLSELKTFYISNLMIEFNTKIENQFLQVFASVNVE